MSEILLQQIEKIPLVKLNKDLFKSLCGLEIEFRNLDGTSIHPSQANSSSENNRTQKFALDCGCNPHHPNCKNIREDILKKVIESKEPSFYTCAGGQTVSVVPILLKQEAIGFLLTCENKSLKFADTQFKTITQTLHHFINYVITNEIHPVILNIYEGKQITRQKEILNRAVCYVKKNFSNNNLTLRDVCDQNGVSYHYLSRLFSKELKTTFAQFRNQVRLEAATKLLKNRNLSVSQISYACGFEDPAYFCKVFRGSFGTTPLSFRFKKPSKAKQLVGSKN